MPTELAAGERGGMTEEQLAEIERIDGYVWQRPYMHGVAEAHRHELLAELTRLRAENERLRACVKAAMPVIQCFNGVLLENSEVLYVDEKPLIEHKLAEWDKARAGLEVK